MSRSTVLWALVALVAAQPASAQLQAAHGLGGGVQFQGYSFSDGLGAQAANLLTIPVAYRQDFSSRVSAEISGGWARGSVEREGRRFLLQGPLDTRVRASMRTTPWSVVTVGVNLPTGKSAHSLQEAVVASVLATDMLGFREANWGTGFGVTTGVAATQKVGAWGLGMGASYRLAGSYEPRSEEDLEYTPGDELRLRVGLDRNVGESGRFTAGVTYQRFATDEANDRNLFQAGNRVRLDGSYAFRLGGSTWTAFAANLWRDNGDLTLDLVDTAGQIVGDTTLVTSSQNLFVAGFQGSVPVGTGFRIRPAADVRFQDRDEGVGSGWLASFGGDVPLRLYGRYEVFPRAALTVGNLEGRDAFRAGFWGGEVGVTVRLRP
ncbi:MAG: hypothetical protein WEA09_14125 [Gemmatimonadota bacterium]